MSYIHELRDLFVQIDMVLTFHFEHPNFWDDFPGLCKDISHNIPGKKKEVRTIITYLDKLPWVVEGRHTIC